MMDLTPLRTLDIQELTIRVSRYDADMKTPLAYQAIAKRRAAPSGPWGVAIRSNPEAAAEAALRELMEPAQEPSRYGF